MKLKGKIEKKDIVYINKILEKLKYLWNKEHGQYTVDYTLHFHETVKFYIDNTIEINILIIENSIMTLLFKKGDLTHDELVKRYTELDSVPKIVSEYQFYIPLTHSIDIDVNLNECRITILNDVDKDEIFRQLKILSGDFRFLENFDYTKHNIFLFSCNSNDYEKVKEKVLSTFHLYKGILEFSFNRFNWNTYQKSHDNNLKEHSCFKYPLFFYVKNDGRFIDIIENENLPYNYMTINTKISQNHEYFKDTIKLFIDKKINSHIEEILSDCFRLYGRGIDTKYVDQCFLYFWNILEKISLSKYGKTEQILDYVTSFCDNEFLENNKYNLKSVIDFRNKRVHTGTGIVTVQDLFIIKYLVNSSILFLLTNHNEIKNKRYLELFYSSKNDNLSHLKEIVKFKTNFNKKLNRKN